MYQSSLTNCVYENKNTYDRAAKLNRMYFQNPSGSCTPLLSKINKNKKNKESEQHKCYDTYHIPWDSVRVLFYCMNTDKKLVNTTRSTNFFVVFHLKTVRDSIKYLTKNFWRIYFAFYNKTLIIRWTISYVLIYCMSLIKR